MKEFRTDFCYCFPSYSIHPTVEEPKLTPKNPSMCRMTRQQAPPLPLKADYDDRPSIWDLIEKHHEEISAITIKLKDDPLFNPTIHDDLWVLRFYLSHKNVNSAVKAAKRTLQFRKDFMLDEFNDIRYQWPMPNNSENLPLPPRPQQKFHDCWADASDSFSAVMPDPNRGVIAYIQMSGMDQHKLMKTMDEESMLHQTIFYNEWLFQVHDEVTRRTGRLTKHLKVVDIQGMTMKNVDRSFMKRDSRIKKKLQDFYPQLLGSALFVNSPAAIQTVWHMFAPLFPKRITNKISAVDPKKKPKDFLLFERYVTVDNLPERYGGNLKGWPPNTY